MIGVSEHLASELPSLTRYAQNRELALTESALRFVNLDAAQINAALGARKINRPASEPWSFRGEPRLPQRI